MNGKTDRFSSEPLELVFTADERRLGGNELSVLFRQSLAVEQAHYKLWLTSPAVLDKVLHGGIYQPRMWKDPLFAL